MNSFRISLARRAGSAGALCSAFAALSACSADAPSRLGIIGQMEAVTTPARTTETAAPTDTTQVAVIIPTSSAPISTGPIACRPAEDALDQFGATVKALKADAAYNYAFDSKLTLENTKLKSSSDLTIDWSALTRDFQDHTLDPTKDVDLVIVLSYPWSVDELSHRLNQDAINDGDQTSVGTFDTKDYDGDGVFAASGATSGKLFSNLTFQGTPLTPDIIGPYIDAKGYPPENNTWLVIAQTGRPLGYGARGLTTFSLDANATGSSVAVTNDTARLQFSTGFRLDNPMPFPQDFASLQLDWSELNVNAMGRSLDELSRGKIKKAFIAHFSQSPATLVTDFLHINDSGYALARYEAEAPAGPPLRFSEFKDSNAAVFPGVTADGTWVVGLSCPDCKNPAPWYMAILKPCTP